MNTKHTPAPWKIEEGKGHYKIFGHNEKTGAHLVAQLLEHGLDWFTEEDKANARLIATAPELLDLAKDALAQLEKMDFSLSANWNGSIKTNVALLLNAAIAKAEGRE